MESNKIKIDYEIITCGDKCCLAKDDCLRYTTMSDNTFDNCVCNGYKYKIDNRYFYVDAN